MENLKYLPPFTLSLPIVAWLIFSVLDTDLSPEYKILGKWDAIKWESVNKYNNPTVNFLDNTNTKELFDLDAEKLNHYKSEKWFFLTNNRLQIEKNDGKIHYANWIIKGRGNILSISYDDKTKENFDIKELNNKNMELHVENRMEIKGLIKLTFIKVI